MKRATFPRVVNLDTDISCGTWARPVAGLELHGKSQLEGKGMAEMQSEARPATPASAPYPSHSAALLICQEAAHLRGKDL